MSAELPPAAAADTDSSRPGPTGASRAAARARFRRALSLMLITVVLPGSAQLLAGDKRVGRIAMRMAGAGLVVAVVLGVIGLVSRGTLLDLATRMWFLDILRFGLIVYAVGWAYLVIDAWRIADPLQLAQKQRLGLTAVNGVLCFSMSGVLLFGSHLVAVQQDLVENLFGDGAASASDGGRYNVLLVGGDAGAGRVGLRPDSMTVASIDEETGRTVLISLPRNLANVPFPQGTPMHRAFPRGFRCEGCYLNGVNTWATDHADEFPKDVEDPGIWATERAVEETTGLPIHYYVMVDLEGFRDLVDAVGGVTIDVHERLPMQGIGDVSHGWIEPGRQHLDGFEALWYARSRITSDDYSRMARQKCLMSGMLHQLDPKTVLTRFGRISKASQEIVRTDMPASEADRFVQLALKAKNLPVSTVSVVPPQIETWDPDFAKIRDMVHDAIAGAEAKDAGTFKPKKRHGHRPDGGGANASADLANAC